MSHEVCEARTGASVVARKTGSGFDVGGGADAHVSGEDEHSFQERCILLEKALMRQSLHRELLYKGLAFCHERRDLRVLEAAIESFPEFSQATQSAYHFIDVLVKAGGLSRLMLDARGVPIEPRLVEGMSEDAKDDLVAGEAFEMTDAGRALVRFHAPQARLAELMDAEPEREGVYRTLLSFCSVEPRSYASIAALVQDDPLLYLKTSTQPMLIQPSVFVDRLQRAAGLAWRDGWVTTEEGKEFLAKGWERRVERMEKGRNPWQ